MARADEIPGAESFLFRALLSGVTGKPAVDGLSPKAIAVSDTMVFVWDPPTKSVRMVRLDRHA